ncbi:MAG: VWA domain-containing protein, partial [Gaiella sp.]
MAAGDAITRHVVTFGRVLREAGLEIGPGRVVDALRALDAVDLTHQPDVYFALRQTLVSRQ